MKFRGKIISYKKAARVAQNLRRRGKKIVLKTGCFDIFHVAHLYALVHAKKQGDVLFVGLGSDKTLRALKGKERPVFPERYRAEVLAALEPVDYVVILTEPLLGRIDHARLLSLIRPHYYLLPPNDKALGEKEKLARKYGIVIRLRPEMKSRYSGTLISTSDILEKLKSLG